MLSVALLLQSGIRLAMTLSVALHLLYLSLPLRLLIVTIQYKLFNDLRCNERFCGNVYDVLFVAVFDLAWKVGLSSVGM